MIADILTNASLYNTADNVSVIFQLKNLHGFADNIRVEASPVMPDIPVDKEAIRKRHTFKDITPEDDDE
jgi:energy-coupling factor transporter ATP-binding protein EcfA2